MIDRDFDKMRAEMDRIERWWARRADSKALAWLPRQKPPVSAKRFAFWFLAWLIVFIILPVWLVQ